MTPREVETALAVVSVVAAVEMLSIAAGIVIFAILRSRDLEWVREAQIEWVGAPWWSTALWGVFAAFGIAICAALGVTGIHVGQWGLGIAFLAPIAPILFAVGFRIWLGRLPYVPRDYDDETPENA